MSTDHSYTYNRVVNLLKEKDELHLLTKGITLVKDLEIHQKKVAKNKGELYSASNNLYNYFSHYVYNKQSELYKYYYLPNAQVVKVSLKQKKNALLLRICYDCGDESNNYASVLIPYLWAKNEELFTSLRKMYVEQYYQNLAEYEGQVGALREKYQEEVHTQFLELERKEEDLRYNLNCLLYTE